jgi:transcriptional regulator with XRE-family HTH domain
MPAASTRPRSARTVLLRMAADQERAERIRALKDERPDLRWKDIAEAVSVTERAAQEWARSGAMDYDKVEKLAAVFGVTADYIWRGTPANGNTPSPFADRDDVLDRLDRIEQAISDIRNARPRHEPGDRQTALRWRRDSSRAGTSRASRCSRARR